MNYTLKAIIAVLIVLSLFSCQKEMDKQEAEKHLKAFDSEIILLAKNLSSTPGIRALESLTAVKNLPLPFDYSITSTPLPFDFQESKGVYNLEAGQKEFLRTHSSDSLIIVFPFQTKFDSVARFVMTSYEEEMSVFGTMVPTSAKLYIEAGGRKILEAISDATLSNGFPVKNVTNFRFGNYGVTASLNTKLRKTKGKVKFDLHIHKSSKPLVYLSSNFDAQLGERSSFTVSDFKAVGHVFPIWFSVESDYQKIDNFATDFTSEFNKHSNIELLDFEGNTKLGDIELVKIPENDRIILEMLYNDGSTANINELLMSIEAIFNIKSYRNRFVHN